MQISFTPLENRFIQQKPVEQPVVFTKAHQALLTRFLAELVEETLAQIHVVPEGQLQKRPWLFQLLH